MRPEVAGACRPVVEGPMARLEHGIGLYVALPALLLLAFGTFYDVSVGNSALAMLIVATLLVGPSQWRALRREPLFWLTVVFTAYVLMGGWALAQARPDWAYTAWNSAGSWLLTPFLGSLVVAFWLGRYPRVLHWLLALLVAGYLLRIFERLSFDLLSALFAGDERATFGNSAPKFGLWSLITTIALIVLLPVAMQLRDRRWRTVALVSCLLALGIALGGLILSQGRSAWIAAALALPTVVYLVLQARLLHVGRKRLLALVAAIVLGGVGGLSLVFHEVIGERLEDNADSIVRIASGEFDDLPSNSPGYRLRKYIVGMETWIEKPVLGHGSGMSTIALAESEDAGIRQFKDFHNSYIVVLAELGLVGFLMLTVLIVLTVRRARQAARDRWLPPACMQFLLGAAVVLAIGQMFLHPIHSYRGPFLLALLIGMAMAHRFRPGGGSQPGAPPTVA